MVTVVKFMLCVFCHNKKRKRKSRMGLRATGTITHRTIYQVKDLSDDLGGHFQF